VTDRLSPGLYEELLTAALETGIRECRLQGWEVDVARADVSVRPEFLARHVYDLLRRALEAKTN
jgi:hypothetical protein